MATPGRMMPPGMPQRRGAGSSAPWRELSVLLILLCLIAASTLSLVAPARAQDEAGAVYVVPITGTIDLGLAPYLSRILDEAEEHDAAAVLLEIDTPGGRLDAVLQMQDALLDADVRTIAFVDRTAFSAGALITIASEEIYMAPGAVMGAATPVDGGTGDTASEKVVSAVRKTFKTTAESRGRDPRVAEAMVDPDVAIDGLVERGKLLTLTTTEATAWGYADGVVANRAELLTAAGLAGASVIETSPSLAERVVRFVTDPVVASLLIIAAFLLIIGDFFVGGVGVVAVGGVALLALFFWGHALAGLTGWEDVALVVVGLILIGIEIFVVPGFGIPGVLGTAALLGGLFLAMLGRDVRTPTQMERAGFTLAAALVAIALGIVAIFLFLPRNRRIGGLVLQSQVGNEATIVAARPTRGWLNWFGRGVILPSDRSPTNGRPIPTSSAERSLVGATGAALTDLRPSGTADIGGRRVDVVTTGGHVTAGEPIEVVRDEGNRRVVRRARS